MKNSDNLNMINCGSVNFYVIRGTDGDILIDTGLRKYRDYIEFGLIAYNIKLIILTHGHTEQTQNARYFSKLFNCKIAMSAYDVNLSRDNTIHKVYNMDLSAKLSSIFKNKTLKTETEKFNVDIFLEDGMSLIEYGVDAKIVSLDGHTRGSVGVLHGNDLYIGDAMYNTFRLGFPSECESPKAVKASIEKIMQIGPDRIMFGHGMPVCYDNFCYKQIFKNW